MFSNEVKAAGQWLSSCPVTNSELMHYVHILQRKKDGNFYTGLTNDLKRRLHEHRSGNVRSTWNRTPLELVYYEACLNEDDTKQRETYLKSGMGKKYIRNRLRRYQENL